MINLTIHEGSKEMTIRIEEEALKGAIQRIDERGFLNKPVMFGSRTEGSDGKILWISRYE